MAPNESAEDNMFQKIPDEYKERFKIATRKVIVALIRESIAYMVRSHPEVLQAATEKIKRLLKENNDAFMILLNREPGYVMVIPEEGEGIFPATLDYRATLRSVLGLPDENRRRRLTNFDL